MIPDIDEEFFPFIPVWSLDPDRYNFLGPREYRLMQTGRCELLRWTYSGPVVAGKGVKVCISQKQGQTGDAPY